MDPQFTFYLTLREVERRVNGGRNEALIQGKRRQGIRDRQRGLSLIPWRASALPPLTKWPGERLLGLQLQRTIFTSTPVFFCPSCTCTAASPRVLEPDLTATTR